MIEIKEVNYGYKEKVSVLKELNLTLSEGHIYGLLGCNGTGKTTLLKLMSGLLLPHKGTIQLDDRSVYEKELDTLSKIYYIPDEIDLPAISAVRYIQLYKSFYQHFDEKIMEKGMEAFHLNSKAPLNKLSLGETKKFAICFGLSTGCKVLLMDEPTNGLDIPSKSIFRKLLMQHLRDEQTVVISTHQIHDVEKLFTDLIVIKDATHTYTASVNEIAEKYNFGIEADKEEALYAEPCPEGFQVIRENVTADDNAINFELLFNAITKGFIK